MICQDVEYRTLDWPKDALYFSYEPNFLFLGQLRIELIHIMYRFQLNDNPFHFDTATDAT